MKLTLRNSDKNLIKTISFEKFELFQNFISELIAFKSDYDNLLGRCRASDIDCNIGQEFSISFLILSNAL